MRILILDGSEYRRLSATKAGEVAAIAELLSHPAVSFVVAAIEDWGKTQVDR